jgi:mannitol operon transcriptional antiterminator
MLFSARQVKMLNTCINRSSYLPVADLAILLSVSKRTILRELNGLSQLPYNLELEYNSQKGVRIIGLDVDKKLFKKELTASTIPYTNKEERQELLILELLRTNEIRKIYYYASLFNVSEATISNDLDDVEDWFNKDGLSISKKTGVGISIIGKEENYRQALANILKKGIQNNPYYRRINIYDSISIQEELFSDKDSSNIFNLLNKDILDRVLIVFNTYNHELELDKYAKASYFGLIIHLTVAIDRILKEDSIESNESIDDLLRDDYCLQQAELMAKKLENEFDIDIPKGEVSYIALHIKGAKKNEVNELEEYDDFDLRLLVKKMLDSMDEKYSKIFIADEQLLLGLIAHLKPTIIRIKYGSNIINPFKEQIMTKYLEYYQQAVLGSKIINEKYSIILSNDEMSYIAMHLGASFERNSYSVDNYSNVRVGIVCASGVGLSALLMARIKKQIGFNIDLVTLSVIEVINKDYDVDILVSTLDIKTEEVILLVNPLLTELDISNIKELVKLYSIKNNCKKRKASNINHKDIINIFRNLQFIYQDRATLDEIYELISIKSMNLDPELLVKDLKTREKLQSNIYDKFNFGLLHCLTTSVTKPQVLFILSDNTFNDEQLKDIKFILVLLAPKTITKSQKQLLSVISRNLLENEELFNMIIQHDEDKIVDILIEVYDKYIEDGEVDNE